MESLKDQAQEIDNPNVPREEGKVFIDLMPKKQVAQSLATFSSPKVVDKALELENTMQQMQPGEFANWDPKLDAGARLGDDQNELRAQNQTAGDLWKAGLFKAVNEIALGTLSATALMGDMDMHLSAFQGVEQDFSNSLSESINKLKEDLNESYGKVYRSKENAGFSPLSGEFWADNAGSVMTAVTLMIPSMAATKGLALLTGATKLPKLIRGMGAVGRALTSKRGTGAVKGITSAVVSRLGENAMEASETVQAIKAELTGADGNYIINPETGVPYTEEEVRKIAGEAGRNTWVRNWPMIAMDIVQYSKAFKGFDYARRSAKEAVKKSMFKQIAGNVGGFVVKDMGGESFEESYQFVSAQEAQYSAKEKAKLVDGDTDFLERLAGYVQEDEFATSALLGAVGGGVFSGISAIATRRQETKRQLHEKQRIEAIMKTHNAALIKSAESFEQAEDQELIVNAIEKAEMGKLQELEADLESLYLAENEDLVDEVEDVEAYKTRLREAQKLVRTIGKEYNRIQNSDIPSSLANAALYSRIDKYSTENQLIKLSKEKEKLFEEDKAVFESKEKSTAQLLLEAKIAAKNNNIARANELTDEILKISNKYKSKEEVQKAMSTSNDAAYEFVEAVEKTLNSRIEAANQFEKDLSTEEGRAKIIKEANKANAAKEKRKAEAAAKAAKASQETTEEEEETAEGRKEPKLTPEQKKYKEERDKAAKEFGEYKTPEPDGKKVFTTQNKKTGETRTWVKGETVKDVNGNEYTVLSKAKIGNGVNLKSKKTGDIVGSYTLQMRHESKKPGRKDWTVNTYTFEKVKERQAREKKEAQQIQSEFNNAQKGIVKSSGQEFSNYKPTKDESGKVITRRNNVVFEFVPETNEKGDTLDTVLSGVEWFPINYEAAASVFAGPQELEIVMDTSKAETALIVKQGDTNLAMIFPRGMETQFNNLREYVSSKGGSIKVTLIGKEVTPEGNLGTIKGNKTNLSRFIGSEFLPKGKVFLGSRKTGETAITFKSSDGDTMELEVPEVAVENNYGVGNSYMAMLTPNGDTIPIQLNETRLSEVTVQTPSGELPVAEVMMTQLEEAALEVEELYNKRITELLAEGKTIEKATKQAQQELGFVDAAALPGDSLLTKKINSVIDPFTRLVKRANQRDEKGNELLDKNNKPYKTYGRNYFNVKFNIVKGETAASNKIVVELSDSVPNPDKGSIHDFVKNTATSREEALDMLGSRFYRMSLDSIRSEDGGQYVKNAIEKGWVTTDINVARPWVNTRLVLELDAEGKKAMQEGLKKPRTKSQTTSTVSGTTKTSQKKAAATKTEDAAKNELIAQANKGAMAVNDIAEDKKGKPEVSLEDFHDEYLKNIVEFEEFNSAVQEEWQKLLSTLDYPDNPLYMLSKYRIAIKSVAKDYILNSDIKEETDFVFDEKFPDLPTGTTLDELLPKTEKDNVEPDTEAKKADIGKNKKISTPTGKSESTSPKVDNGIPGKSKDKSKSITQSEVKSKRSSIFNKKSKTVETTSTESATVTHGGEIPNPTLTGATIDSLLEGTVNNDVQSMGSTLSKKGITKARKKTNNGDLDINCKR